MKLFWLFPVGRFIYLSLPWWSVLSTRNARHKHQGSQPLRTRLLNFVHLLHHDTVCLSVQNMIISALHSGTVLPQEGSLTVLHLQLRNRWSDHQLRSLLQFNIPLFYSLISNIHNNNAAGFEVFNIFFLSAAEGYSIRRPQPISAAERECFLYKSCEESEVFQEKLILSYNPPCLFFNFIIFPSNIILS